MTDPREKLAMLQPHGPHPDTIFGGTPVLTGLDVAAAMGMAHMDRLTETLLRVKYLDDQALVSELWAKWVLVVTAEGARAGWPREPGRCWVRIAEWSLEEAVASNCCRRCKGVGTIRVEEKVIVCAACDGTGRRYRSTSAMAREMGLPRRTFLRRYREPLSWARRRLLCIEDGAVVRLGRALGQIWSGEEVTPLL